jgi:HSP20 family molecular chaperone IbpA
MLALALLALALPAAASEPGPWRRLWGWGPDPLRDKYEELFDVQYPWRSYDPFNRVMPFEDVRHFNRQVDMRAAGAAQRVTEDERTVTLSIVWPGSAEEAMDVVVHEGLVRLTPSAAQAAQGASRYRFRARGSRQLATPVPARAKASTASISRVGDEIRVVFEKSAG